MSLFAAGNSSGIARKKVLVVDDQPAHRLILERLLLAQGFEVILACNGQEGVDQFQRHRPALVFMDALMPVMDGCQATRKIKSLPDGHFTPVIFLTCLEDPQDLKRCIDAGGDDFLSKPVNKVVLKARILALERTRNLYKALREQHQVLSAFMEAETANKKLAHQVFSHAMSARKVSIPGVSVVSHSAASFSGDLVLYNRLPTGELRVLLADFTGHGMPAAICALPVSEIFHAMTSRGCTQTALLNEINSKLCSLLPDDRFMATVCIDLAKNCEELILWSGGMPPCLLLQDETLSALPSKGLPLGILESYDFASDQHRLACLADSRLLIMSDGFQDMRNPEGQMLIQSPLYDEFLDLWMQPNSDLSFLAAKILDQHSQRCPLVDDITLVELNSAQLKPDH